MSSIPIITQIRDRIAVILAGQVTANVIGSYLENPPEEFDKETAKLPLSGYRIVPQEWEERNRLEYNNLLFHLQTYHENNIGRNEVLDQGDLIEANLHKAIFEDCKDGVLHSLTQKIIKTPSQNLLVDDYAGIVVMQYSLITMHKYGDGFTNENY